jgi:hypothetical protein
MRTRCYNPHDVSYPNYGARGIRVCDRWRESFEQFFVDVGPRPSPDHSIDRIDNDGHYEPGNVRWATRDEQGHNQRTNRQLTLDGTTKTLAAWARAADMSVQALSGRLKSGMSLREALHKPIQLRKPKARCTHPAKNTN